MSDNFKAIVINQEGENFSREIKEINKAFLGEGDVLVKIDFSDLNTLREILEHEFKGVYVLKVIDVLKQPQLAEEDKILATPTLAKILPPPVRKIIGDLSDREKVLIGLDLLFDELTETEYSGDK